MKKEFPLKKKKKKELKKDFYFKEALKCTRVWICGWRLNLRNQKLVKRKGWCNQLLATEESSDIYTYLELGGFISVLYCNYLY